MAKSGLRFQAKSDRADPSYPFPSRFGADGDLKRKEKNTTTAYYYSLEPYGLEDDEVELEPDKSKQQSLFSRIRKDKKDLSHNKFAFDQKKWLNNMHTTERRYNYRNTSFEKKFETEEDGVVTHTDHPLLAKEEAGYEETEADDLRDRMIEYVREKFPKNGLYAEVLALYLKNGYGTRTIGEKLGIKERSARFFLASSSFFLSIVLFSSL